MKYASIKIVILIVFAVTANFSTRAQVFTNGGFEYFGNPDTPVNWKASLGEIQLDSLVKHSGKYSARITSGDSPMGNYYVTAVTLPGYVVKNKKIEMRAKLKRDLIDTALTGLFMRELSPGSIHPAQLGDSLAGKSDWEEVSMSMAVGTPSILAIGAIISGQGTVWIDDIEVYADEERIDDYFPRQSQLTEVEKRWLGDNTYLLYPKMNGRIGNFVGNARVVGLGEITHGSASVKRARNQIIKHLIEDKGFTIIAQEGFTDFMWEDVNESLLSQDSFSSGVITKLGADYETVALVEWLAAYNRRTGRNVRLMGAEIRQIGFIIDHVGMLRDDILWEPLATMRQIILPVSQNLEMFGPNSSPKFSPEQTKKILDALSICREWAQNNIVDAMDLDLMMHNLDLIEKYIDLSEEKRDPIMADNIEWISKRYPDEKIIFLAHNTHTGIIGLEKHTLYTEGSAGYHLRQKFGDYYYTVGACFYEGTYGSYIPQLGGKSVPQVFTALTAFPGTYEYLFNSISKPDFFLPLRGVTTNDDNGWLVGPMEFRTIGAIYGDYGFSPTSLPEQFDAVVFIRESKSAVQ